MCLSKTLPNEFKRCVLIHICLVNKLYTLSNYVLTSHYFSNIFFAIIIISSYTSLITASSFLHRTARSNSSSFVYTHSSVCLSNNLKTQFVYTHTQSHLFSACAPALTNIRGGQHLYYYTQRAKKNQQTHTQTLSICSNLFICLTKFQFHRCRRRRTTFILGGNMCE